MGTCMQTFEGRLWPIALLVLVIALTVMLHIVDIRTLRPKRIADAVAVTDEAVKGEEQHEKVRPITTQS